MHEDDGRSFLAVSARVSALRRNLLGALDGEAVRRGGLDQGLAGEHEHHDDKRRHPHTSTGSRTLKWAFERHDQACS
ncbi:MAG: hypothetical protein ACLSVD_13130 [Eggerthellaceae bacterium]